VHVFVQTGWDDVFDDLGLQELLPVVVNLLQLLVEACLLVLLEGLDQEVLFLDQLLDLVLLVRVTSVGFKLLCELFDLLGL
jgi:hypothetical protein